MSWADCFGGGCRMEGHLGSAATTQAGSAAASSRAHLTEALRMVIGWRTATRLHTAPPNPPQSKVQTIFSFHCYDAAGSFPVSPLRLTRQKKKNVHAADPANPARQPVRPRDETTTARLQPSFPPVHPPTLQPKQQDNLDRQRHLSDRHAPD